LRLYVGYLGADPVATAELAIGGGVVGLYGVSTRAAHRRCGYGTALTAYSLREGRAAGFRTAILQAVPDVVGVYCRPGFEAFGEFVEYKP
jgi:predicted acetyltransferase